MNSLHEIAARLSSLDADALPVDAVHEVIQASIEPVSETQTVALAEALGRVLAEDLVSPIDVPAYANSAMDGYAFAGAQCGAYPLRLQVIGAALAGHPYPNPVPLGACVRIMTGAVLPEGCDTVVPIERCTQDGEQLVVPETARVRAGDHRRRAGEDLRRGQTALPAGRCLTPADLGLSASLGIASVVVRRRVRVAYFSTGDELRAPGSTLGAGQIYDSNGAGVRGMLERLGIEVLDLGIVPDVPERLEAAFMHACAHADAVITSGGVGMGDADHTRALLARLGEVCAWSLALRPGRPMAFGRLRAQRGASTQRDCYLFGLPGNPVAAMVSFYALVRPALQRLQGMQAAPMPRLRVRNADLLRKRPGRTEYQRGVVYTDAQGRTAVRSTGPQGSGVLRSMCEANCLIVLEHERGDVAPGDWVDVLMFEGLI